MNKSRSNKYVNEGIETLNLSNKTKEKLLQANLDTVGKVWILKRKDLKDYGLSDNEINQVIIKLQLLGLDLNRKVY